MPLLFQLKVVLALDMDNGLYISTYLHIDPLAHAMGCSRRHDQCISLWELEKDQVRLIRHWELERYSGQKNHYLPIQNVQRARELIDYLLDEEGLDLADVVAVFGTPGLDTIADYDSSDEYSKISYHSICHIFSSLLCAGDLLLEEKILAFAVDCAPDNVVQKDAFARNYFCACISDRGKLDIFPTQSPAPLWTEASERYGMLEGSLMALASATSINFKYTPPEIPRLMGGRITNNRKAAEAFMNTVEAELDDLMACNQDVFDQRFSYSENRTSMIMKAVQRKSLDIMNTNIVEAAKRSGLNLADFYLATSGGYALNCPTNTHLITKYSMKGFIACPAANDGGQSLGIGSYYFQRKSRSKLRFSFENAYYGGNPQTDLALGTFSRHILSTSEFDADKAVEDLENGVMAWVDGRAEIGPRALGHRSLLGDPRKLSTRNTLNRLKKRLWWRPVAPVVLLDHVSAYFDGTVSPYMLQTFTVKESKWNIVPAIVHNDGSARVQTLTRESNRLLYSLIETFYRRTGVPMLCNTSLNDKGEPIVNTAEQAIRFALRKGLTVVYSEGIRIELRSNEISLEPSFDRSLPGFQLPSLEAREEQIKEYNPHGITKHELELYYHLEHRFDSVVDFRDEKSVKKLQRTLKAFKQFEA